MVVFVVPVVAASATAVSEGVVVVVVGGASPFVPAAAVFALALDFEFAVSSLFAAR